MTQDRIVGWEEYDEFLSFLDRLGISYVQLEQEWRSSGFLHQQRHDLRKQGFESVRLRKAAYVHPITGRHIVLEEYVRSIAFEQGGLMLWTVELVRYRAGERPDLEGWKETLFPDREDES